jgi:hypothetical protein
LTYNGGGTGLFGGKANSRQIPQNVINTTTPIPGTLNFNDPAKVASNLEKADTVNSAMRQMSPVIGLTNKAPPPNMSFNLQGGDSIELGQYEKVGVIGAFSYRNKYSYYGNGTRGNLALLATTNPTVFTATNPVSQQMQGKQEVLWGGLIGLSGQWDKDHKASINVMYNRGADDNATQRSDVADDGSQTDYQQIIDYGQRSLAYLQVIGEDVFEEARNFKINWNGGLGQAQLQEPDQRQFTYGLTDSGTYFDLDSATSEADVTDDTLLRFQRQLTENSYYGIVDFTIPMFEEKERTDAFTTGFYQDYSQRDYSQSSFNYPYGFYGAGNPDLDQQTYTPKNGETWADVFLSPERSGLVNPTGLDSNYMMSYSIFNQAGDTAANGNNPGTDYQASQAVTAS